MWVVNCQHKNTSVHTVPLVEKMDNAIQQINHYPLHIYHVPKHFEFLSSSSSSRNNNDDDDNNNNNNSFSLRGYLAHWLIEKTTIFKSIQIIKCWFLLRGEYQSTQEKPVRAGYQQLNSHWPHQ